MTQHNGVAKMRNQTLLDMVRSMMSKVNLPKSLWGDALETIVYILNRVPSKLDNVTPYEIWTNKKPYLSHMKVWGCPAYVKRILSNKLEAKSDNCLFVQYPKKNNGISVLQLFGTKSVCLKACCFLSERVSS